jgi:hypothetical protein
MTSSMTTEPADPESPQSANLRLEVSGGWDHRGTARTLAQHLRVDPALSALGLHSVNSTTLYSRQYQVELIWSSPVTLARRPRVSEALIAAIDGLGLRLRAISLSAWERDAGRVWDPQPRATHLEILRRRAADPAFGPRLLTLLAHDRAVGSLRQPDLVAELHLGLAPEVAALANEGLRWGPGLSFSLSAAHLGLPAAIVPGVAAATVAAGWLEDVVLVPGLGPLADSWNGSVGPKGRKLTRRELVWP